MRVGAAQWLINFVFRLHMITPPYTISEFSFGTAAALIVLTGCSGYIFGFVIGFLWSTFLASGTPCRQHSGVAAPYRVIEAHIGPLARIAVMEIRALKGSWGGYGAHA